MTAEEFLALGETDQRLELVDGVVVMSPSPVPLHQRIARLIMRQLEDTAPVGAQLFHETDIVLAERLVYCPDIVGYGAGRLPGVPARLDVPPDLVIEILSPGNRKIDLVTKRDDYHKHGVLEYWVVDPGDLSVRVYRPRDGSFEARDAGGVLESSAIPGVRVDFDQVRLRAVS